MIESALIYYFPSEFVVRICIVVIKLIKTSPDLIKKSKNRLKNWKISQLARFNQKWLILINFFDIFVFNCLINIFIKKQLITSKRLKIAQIISRIDWFKLKTTSFQHRWSDFAIWFWIGQNLDDKYVGIQFRIVRNSGALIA